mmetsp:Transcript_2960/g.8469  ORF Transcript_2960/g.8469 Transcript_2960/m.8469 type:complete len:414 (-) Transcript_2960:46-1287(-)
MVLHFPLNESAGQAAPDGGVAAPVQATGCSGQDRDRGPCQPSSWSRAVAVEEIDSILGPGYRAAASEFVGQRPIELARDGLGSGGGGAMVCVDQGEYGVSSPMEAADGGHRLRWLGSDDATTCLLLALRSTASGATAAAHLDIPERVPSLAQVETRLLRGAADSALDVYLAAGLAGDKESLATCAAVLSFLACRPVPYRLQLAAVCDLNVGKEDGLDPVPIRGMAVDLGTGQLHPAHFADDARGPLHDLRSLRLSVVSSIDLTCVYDSEVHAASISVPPFDWRGIFHIPGLQRLCRLPDPEFLAATSTSPDLEQARFCEDMRRKFRLVWESDPCAFFGVRVNEPASADLLMAKPVVAAASEQNALLRPVGAPSGDAATAANSAREVNPPQPPTSNNAATVVAATASMVASPPT